MLNQSNRITLKEYHEFMKSEKAKAKSSNNKYNNKITIVNGIKFSSRKEAKRYGELLLLVRSNKITDLRMQVPFELVDKQLLAGESRVKSAIRYVCDFCYYDISRGGMIIEDVKSDATKKNKLYRTKKHLMKALLGLDIIEI